MSGGTLWGRPRPGRGCSAIHGMEWINAWETWTVAASDGVHCAHVRWEINFLFTFETTPFFCVYLVYNTTESNNIEYILNGLLLSQHGCHACATDKPSVPSPFTTVSCIISLPMVDTSCSLKTSENSVWLLHNIRIWTRKPRNCINILRKPTSLHDSSCGFKYFS